MGITDYEGRAGIALGLSVGIITARVVVSVRGHGRGSVLLDRIVVVYVHRGRGRRRRMAGLLLQQLTAARISSDLRACLSQQLKWRFSGLILKRTLKFIYCILTTSTRSLILTAGVGGNGVR